MIELDKDKCSRLIVELVALKHKFCTAGMFRTMHSLEVAVTQSGWELAEYLTKLEKEA